jgi:hypothetical protein
MNLFLKLCYSALQGSELAVSKGVQKEDGLCVWWKHYRSYYSESLFKSVTPFLQLNLYLKKDHFKSYRVCRRHSNICWINGHPRKDEKTDSKTVVQVITATEYLIVTNEYSVAIKSINLKFLWRGTQANDKEENREKDAHTELSQLCKKVHTSLKC